MSAASTSEPPWLREAAEILGTACTGEHEAAFHLLDDLAGTYGSDVVPDVLVAWAVAATEALRRARGQARRPGTAVRLIFADYDTGEVFSAAEASPPNAWAGRFIAAVAAQDTDMVQALVRSVEDDDTWRANIATTLVGCAFLITRIDDAEAIVRTVRATGKPR